MLRNLLITGAVLTAATGVAFANGGTYVSPSYHHPDVYVGVGVSRDFAHYEPFLNSYERNSTQDKFRRSQNTLVDLGNDGWNGELFAGLGYTFQDHYYLGAEIFGSVSNVDVRINNTSYDSTGKVTSRVNSKLELKHSYGISVIPGVKVSPSTMLYGRVGLIRSKFEASTAAFGVRGSDSKTKNGLQLGVGIQTAVTNNVTARVEYDWNHYGKLVNHTVTGPFGLVRANAGIKDVNVDQAKLEVAYHFMAA